MTRPLIIQDELHVWRAPLDRDAAAADDLPPGERERAAGFLRPEAAGRWTASRRALRRVLAEYLGQDPAEIEIVVEENGKPRLADKELEFNLSHSGELALIAVSGERPVGVDVEKVEPARDLLALAERALDEDDVAKVRAATSDEERAAVFYAAWVRHEARLKCLGAGLTGPVPDEPVAVQDVDVDPGYAAAVAVAGASPATITKFGFP